MTSNRLIASKAQEDLEVTVNSSLHMNSKHDVFPVKKKSHF